jgi:phosphoenolpyruvate synthase/pyruvate phosphate dikinase
MDVFVGGLTAHTSMVMRTTNKPAVTEVSDLKLGRDKQELLNEDGSHVLHAGNVITVDGSSGSVYVGTSPFVLSRARTSTSPL